MGIVARSRAHSQERGAAARDPRAPLPFLWCRKETAPFACDRSRTTTQYHTAQIFLASGKLLLIEGGFVVHKKRGELAARPPRQPTGNDDHSCTSPSPCASPCAS